MIIGVKVTGMAKIKYRPEFAIAICELLGLDPGDVSNITLRIDPSDGYKVDVTMFFTTEVYQKLNKVIRSYQLNPTLIEEKELTDNNG